MSFDDKTVLVTGGSTGIGRDTALAFANRGARVLITGRTEETLRATAAAHPNIDYLVADVADPADVDRTITEVRRRFDGLDVLVNNAGIAPVAPAGEVPLAQVDEVFGINVRGPIDLTQKALPLLRARKGNVVNVGTVLIEAPQPMMSVYTASKAALTSLTKSWAEAFAGDGIRVNIVHPGPIETPIYGKTGLAPDVLQQFAAQVQDATLLKRFGQPAEVASAIAWLASDEASYVTGTQLQVGGGMLA